MPRYVALLQGINVGKNRRIAMSDLKAMAEVLGYSDVRTHLNSGNVVFTTERRDDAGIARELESAIAAKTGFDVPVVVRSGEELRAIVANNPFPAAAADHRTLHVAFLREEPAAEKVAALEARDTGEDDWRLVGKDVYLFYPNRTTGATFTLDGIGVVATSRNWRTVARLAELASEG